MLEYDADQTPTLPTVSRVHWTPTQAGTLIYLTRDGGTNLNKTLPRVPVPY